MALIHVPVHAAPAGLVPGTLVSSEAILSGVWLARISVRYGGGDTVSVVILMARFLSRWLEMIRIVDFGSL
jgi:hypothetical protein